MAAPSFDSPKELYEKRWGWFAEWDELPERARQLWIERFESMPTVLEEGSHWLVGKVYRCKECAAVVKFFPGDIGNYHRLTGQEIQGPCPSCGTPHAAFRRDIVRERIENESN